MTKTYTDDVLPSDFRAAFKDADIRGVYPSEIDEVVAYRVARACVEEFALSEVIVARDMRVSSPSLRAAFIAGVRDSGADAIDVGLVGTPALYYASGSYDAFGVMITASHNPKDYNGLKLVRAGAVPLTNKTGLAAIKKRIVKGEFITPPKPGALKTRSIERAYHKYVESRVPLAPKKPLRIVIDAGNGMAATLQPLLDRLPFTVTPLFFTLDGTFPNRDSNPTLRKNQTAITHTLRQGSYDLGVSFDGDADRLAFFDEKGTYINSAVVGAMLVRYLLEIYPHATFVYTVFTSKIYEETIKQYGGTAVRARVGHAFIKEVMRTRDAQFACEHSAHFYFKDNYYADSGILTLLYVAAAYTTQREAGETFSQFLRPFQKYYQTEEVLVRVQNKRATLESLAQYYEAQSPEAVVRYDGVTVRFADYWFTVKPSVTEDALKYVVEAPKKVTAIAGQKEVRQFLERFAQ